MISASRGVETHPAVEEGTPFRGSRGPGRMHSRAAGRPGDAAVRPKTQEDEVGGAGASARAHARGRPHLSNRECRCKGQRARGAPGTHAPRLRRSLHHSHDSTQSLSHGPARPRMARTGAGLAAAAVVLLAASADGGRASLCNACATARIEDPARACPSALCFV